MHGSKRRSSFEFCPTNVFCYLKVPKPAGFAAVKKMVSATVCCSFNIYLIEKDASQKHEEPQMSALRNTFCLETRP